jgi:DNA polymerase-3 subunit chi
MCSTQSEAEAFDEFIWQYPADKFIPHNLYGEGPDMGTPVEILWLAAYSNMAKIRNSDMLIMLSNSHFEAHQQAKHIVDFVPADEVLKAQARERYSWYKKAGCQLKYTGI